MSASTPVRFIFAVIALVGSCAALNLFDDWTRAEMPARFVVAGVAAGIAFLIGVSDFPASLSAPQQRLLFWSVAVGLRLLALPLEPGDDFWRYQWEGKIQRAGFNPYLHAPDDPVLEPLREQFPAWEKINHREVRAIYPPGGELVFRGLSAISENPLFYKLVFAVADLGCVAVLLWLIGRPCSYARAAWYAWNPLVVYSFAGSAHFDSLMILPMLAGVCFLVRMEGAETAGRRTLCAVVTAVLFGTAISIKLIPILLMPLCAFALRWRTPVLLVSLAIPAALAAGYGFPTVPVWDSLRQFAHVTRVNDLFWWMVEGWLWPNPDQKNYRYNIIIVLTAVALSLVFMRDWRRGMLWVMGATLIFGPVLHPWYCTWILPLAAWRRVYPWQVLSVTLFAYYLFWAPQLFAVRWRAELWLRALIILPPLLAAILYVARGRERPAIAAL